MAKETQNFGVRLEVVQHQRLHLVASITGLSASDIARDALEEKLQALERSPDFATRRQAYVEQLAGLGVPLAD